MSEAHLSSYEEMPYESKPLYPTHPDCLGAVATLLGMKPAPVDRCRVLELGCASGGNLIPMAEALPHSRFVGIDLSPRQIGAGVEMVKALGLKNIELRALSILDVDDTLGQFDYIACHGVYSWVPPAVQDKILSICRRNLAPQGVAYISYNTLPGWHLRGLVREMMGYHVQRFTEPTVRVGQARAFLDFLVEAVPDQGSTYHRVLKEEAEVLRPAADTYLFHEHLEDANAPVYFSQFMDRAHGHDLQYLGESWYHTHLDNLPDQVRTTLQGLSENLIQLEQYLDFLHNRTFRRTLLCHKDVALDRTPSPRVLTAYHLSALARPVSTGPDLDSDAVEKFTLDNGTTASTNVRLIKAALTALHAAWPRTLSFDTLWQAVQSRLPSLAGQGPRTADVGPRLLAETMLRCYLSNLVAMHLYPPHFVLEPGTWPEASPLARLQAATGPRLTNRRHRLVQLGELDCALLRLLDGSRNHAALLEALTDQVVAKQVTVAWDGEPLYERDKIRAFLDRGLDGCLRVLGRNALLIA